jgi:WD40 repeat protein/tRNA A-37 threonylcarbamoyl transferase component Bud32
VEQAQLGQATVCRRCGRQITLRGSAGPPQLPLQASDTPAGRQDTPLEMSSHDWPKCLGRFQIRARIGVGGFGAVYRAYDPVLDREVALKVPRAEVLREPKARARFLREPKAAAQLRHPHIVPIYEAGGDGDHYYIASAFIEGQTLKDAIEDQQPDFRRVARIVRDLADALDYAHGMGVIHRDVKPANVMIDSRGQPLLMDFGLAHWKQSGEKLTQDGSMMGTPAYMAPEQADRSVGEVGPASDQYSLGVVLYELLGGNIPFSGPAAAVIFNHLHQPPESPRRLNPRVPKDLETICLKAMAKRPGDRYANCAALSEDLRRWLDGEPVRARQMGVGERLVRWRRRNPVAAALSATTAILLVVVAIVTSVSAVRTSRALAVAELEQSRAEQEWARAEANLREARRQQQRAEQARREAEVRLVELERQRKETERERKVAEGASQTAQNERNEAQRQRDEAKEARANESLATHKVRTKLAEEAFSRGSTLCEQGEAARGILFLARALADLPADERELQTAFRLKLAAWLARIYVCRLEIEHPGTVLSLAVGGDGRQVLTGGDDHTARLWDTERGLLIGEPMGHRDKVTAVAFQPHGRILATGSADGVARLWESATGRPLSRSFEHQVGITAVAFSPDGKLLLTAGGHTVQKWEVASRKPVGRRLEHLADVQTAAFSPDGTMIVAGFKGVANGAQLWDAVTGLSIGQPWQQSDPVSTVGFCFKSGKMLVGDAADQAQLWNWTTKQPFGPPLKHLGNILAAAINDDGSSAVTGSQDHTARLWNLTTGLPIGFPMQHRGPVTCVAFNPVNDGVITGSFGSLRFWNPQHPSAGVRLERTLEHTGAVGAVAFSPRGDRCATGTGAQQSGVIQLWDCSTGRPVGKPVEGPHPISSIKFSPDGKLILTAEGNVAVLRDTATGERVGLRLRHAKNVHAAAFSNDGKFVVTGSADGTARVWEAPSGRPTQSVFQHADREVVLAVAFSPDGKTVVTGTEAGMARQWNVASGQEVRQAWQHGGPVYAVSFSPDGKTVATAGEDQLVRLWSSATGQSQARSLGHSTPVYAISFSPDGRMILTGGRDGYARLWDVVSGKEVARSQKHGAAVLAVAFRPDGRAVLTGCQDKLARLWQLPPMLPGDPAQIMLWVEANTGMELDANGEVRQLDHRAWQHRREQLKAAE